MTKSQNDLDCSQMVEFTIAKWLIEISRMYNKMIEHCSKMIEHCSKMIERNLENV
jgi:hypothetical protein